jgi:predicted DNA-binding ribbon-helix-helix protein
MRLNHLVGALASRHPDALGFAASLRLFCLRETAQRLAAAGRIGGEGGIGPHVEPAGGDQRRLLGLGHCSG